MNNVIRITTRCARAIREGRKSMVRVVDKTGGDFCPLGGPGDLLQVREPSGEYAQMVLEIRALRRELLQDISAADVEAEGELWKEPGYDPRQPPRQGFARWWDSVHARAEAQWLANPAVWVLQVAER